MHPTSLSGCISNPLELMNQRNQLSRIRKYRDEQYKQRYPEIDNLEKDPFDENAIIMFSVDNTKAINSTGRLVIDSQRGLPEDDIFFDATESIRQEHLTAEFGRFATSSNSSEHVKSYYSSIHALSLFLHVDVIFMVMREKDFAIHRRLMKAEILPSKAVENGFGSSHNFISVAWWIDRTPPSFFNWCGARISDQEKVV